MSMRLSGGEFRSLGLAIDPDDPSRAIQVASIEGILPDDSWDLDRLALYASSGLNEASRLEKESIQIGRRSTVQVYRSGMALSIARRRLKAQGRGCWGRWLEEHGFKRTTAWEAAELFERAGSEEEVEKLTSSEAKLKFGIVTSTGKDPAPSRNRRNPEPSKRLAEVDLDDEDRALIGREGRGEGDSEDGGSVGDEDRGGDDGEDQPSSERYQSQGEVLICPPKSLREVLVAVCNLLLECERRIKEVDSSSFPLVAEITEIAGRLRTETVA